ncbi:hypothetical protein HF086_003308 [Spodoptera exigua]|uniref:Uncharacterized protein n=1 Tax=Spodoptera exigua TaxID=7107 RepID=A0A922MXZ2_SPOEX|nr:hypothetical protein HF086_003308 [Spodoptera exigua]
MSAAVEGGTGALNGRVHSAESPTNGHHDPRPWSQQFLPTPLHLEDSVRAQKVHHHATQYIICDGFDSIDPGVSYREVTVDDDIGRAPAPAPLGPTAHTLQRMAKFGPSVHIQIGFSLRHKRRNYF